MPGVLSGRTASWFSQPGGGWQYKLPGRIMNMADYLEEVDNQ
ncbi:glycohydrolase toxin TNT-related protein [Phascolarctobacterium faecium]